MAGRWVMQEGHVADLAGLTALGTRHAAAGVAALTVQQTDGVQPQESQTNGAAPRAALWMTACLALRARPAPLSQ